jgi:hypothetical protein
MYVTFYPESPTHLWWKASDGARKSVGNDVRRPDQLHQTERTLESPPRTKKACKIRQLRAERRRAERHRDQPLANNGSGIGGWQIVMAAVHPAAGIEFGNATTDA